MTVDELKAIVSNRLHDVAQQVVTDDQILRFLNAAVRDARNLNWLNAIADTDSVAVASNKSTVPADYVYLTALWTGASFDTEVLPHEWYTALEGSTPIIRYRSEFTADWGGGSVRVVGFKLPTESYTDDTDELDAEMEAFLRERTVAYAADHLSNSGSAWARQYDQLFQDAYAVSNELWAAQLTRQNQQLAEAKVVRRVKGR